MLKLEIEVTNLQRTSLKKSTARKEFMQKCLLCLGAYKSHARHLDLEPNSSDDERSGAVTMTCSENLKRIYASVVDRVTSDLAEASKKEAKARKAQEDAEAQVIQAGPAAILQTAVKEEIDKTLGRKSKQNSKGLPSGYKYMDLAADTLAGGAKPSGISDYFDPMSKNGGSPAVMAGAESNMYKGYKTKGSGKNYQRAQNKSKGKGRANGKSKSKGKGKGSAPKSGKVGKSKAKGKGAGPPKGQKAHVWNSPPQGAGKGRKTKGDKYGLGKGKSKGRA